MKVADYKGFEIHYLPEVKRFQLRQDGQTLAHSEKQEDLEQRVNRMMKAHPAFPIPLLMLYYDGKMEEAKITSADLDQDECWVSVPGRSDRGKFSLRHPSGKYFADTPHNRAIFRKVEALRERAHELDRQEQQLMEGLKLPLNRELVEKAMQAKGKPLEE